MAVNKPSWNYEKWQRLQTGDFLKTSARFNMSKDVLTLTERGRGVAFEHFLDPVNPPFADFVYHDSVVAQFAITIEREGLISKWQSEQELKKLDAQRYPYSGRKAFGLKFPDLMIKLNIPGSDTFLAVEFELSRKSNDKYKDFVNKYRRLGEVDTVVVFAKSNRIIDAIKLALTTTNYPQQIRPFVFGLISGETKDFAGVELDYKGTFISLREIVHNLRDSRKNKTPQSSVVHRNDIPNDSVSGVL